MPTLALAAVVAVAAVALPGTSLAKDSRLFFEDNVRAGKSTWVEHSIHRAASFRVVLRVPTQGRAQLFLTGKTAPRGGH